MLPPGLSFNAVSAKALAASRQAKLPRSYWAWDEILEANRKGYWPSTPATNLLYGLQAALDQLLDEGLPNVFARHDRHAEATRRAVRGWNLEILCANPAEYSSSLTAVMMPPGHDADAFRSVVLQHLDMSLGTGLSKLAGKVFRIGHLGDFNDLMLMGTLSGVEIGLGLANVPHRRGGVQVGLDYLVAARAAPKAIDRAA
jgi:alanine-glyoxylate transaminase/serine-glyoxylate transaminase/serine-pyruvate transaminase